MLPQGIRQHGFVWSRKRKIETHFRRLVVLDQATKGTFSCAEGPIKHVNVDLVRLVLLFKAASNFEFSGLCESKSVFTLITNMTTPSKGMIKGNALTIISAIGGRD